MPPTRRALSSIALGPFVLGATQAEEGEAALPKERIVAAAREARRASAAIFALHRELLSENLTEDPAKPLAFSDLQRDRYLAARKQLLRAVELNPYQAESYLLLANSYWDLEDDLDTTLHYYNKCLALDPDYADVLSARAQVLIRLHRLPEAKADLEKLESLRSELAEGVRREFEEAKEAAGNR